MKLHHVGILTKNIKKTQVAYETLGYKAEGDVIRDEFRGVDILFMLSQNDVRIELVSPFKDNSVVSKFPKHVENSMYHTCYIVKDMDLKIVELSKKYFLLIDKPKPAIAFNNKKVCFLLSKETGIIELLEE